MSEFVIKTTKNTIFNFLNTISSFLGGAVLSIIIARGLGPKLLGQYSFITYLIVLITTIFALGLPSTLTRYIAEYTGKNDQASISHLIILSLKILLILSLIASLVFFIIFNIAGDANPSLKSIQYAILATLCIAPTLIASIFRSILTGYQDFLYLLKVNIVSNTTLLVADILVILTHFNIKGLLMVNLLINVLVIILIYSKYRTFKNSYLADSQSSFNYNKLVEIYKYIWPLAIISIIDMIVWQSSEIIFLGIFRTTQEIAFYTIPFNISFMIMSALPGAFITTLVPLLSSFYGKNSVETMEKIFYTSFKLVTYLIIPICFGVSLLSKVIITTLYGNNYLTAYQFLPPLIISSGLGFIAATGSSLLYSIKKQIIILKLMAMVFLINISLDIILIPTYGIIGAVIANVSAQLTSTIFTLVFAFRVYKKYVHFSVILKPLFSASLMSLIILMILKYQNNLLGLIISIFIGTISYLIFLLVIKGLNNDDKNILLGLGEYFPSKIKPIYTIIINKLIL